MEGTSCYIEQIALMNSKKLIIEGWIASESGKLAITLIQNGREHNCRILNFYPREDVAEALKINLKDAKGFYAVFDCNSFSVVGVVITEDGKEILRQETEPIRKQEEEIQKFVDTVSYHSESQELKIRGWAFCKLEQNSVKVRIYAKGTLLEELSAGKTRSDVHNAFRKYATSGNCGFSRIITTKTNYRKLDFCFVSEEGTQEWVRLEVGQAIEKPVSKLGILLKTTINACKKVVSGKVSIRECFRRLGPALADLRHELKKDSLKKSLKHRSREELWLKNNQYPEALKKRLKEYIGNQTILAVVKVKEHGTSGLERQIAGICKQSGITNIVLLFSGQKEKERFQLSFKTDGAGIILATPKEAYKRIRDSKEACILLMQEGIVPGEEAAVELLLEYGKGDTDLLYSDSRFQNGKFNLKPDWSPEHILSCNYIGGCILTSKSVCLRYWNQITAAGEEFIYDYILRAAEDNAVIGHIAKVLYTEERNQDFTAGYENQKVVLENCLKRRGIQAEVMKNSQVKQEEYPVFRLKFPDQGETVNIIIPTKNGKELLCRCLESLKRTTYQNYIVTVLDNESDDPEILDYFERIKSERVQVKRIQNEKNRGFSYSYLNNTAALQSSCSYLLFLNNDTEVISGEWLSSMVGYLKMNRVGITGAKLLFPDDTIQHAGIVMGLYDRMAAPAFKLQSVREKGYLNFDSTTRNYSAVTAACMLIRTEDFISAGMFDDTEFSIAYNDLDLCMKVLLGQKKTCVFVAEALLYHYEGATRGYVDRIEETAAFREKYKAYRDPYYNVNLSEENEQFELSADCSLTAPSLRSPRVMFVLHNLNYEGAPLQMLEIAKGMAQDGKIIPLIAAAEDGKLAGQIRKDFQTEPEVIPCEIKKITSYEAYDRLVESYAECMRRRKADLVAANTIECFFAVEAAKRAGIRAIWAIHESVDCFRYFSGLNWKIQQSYLNCYSYVYKLIFCAKATQKMYQEVDVNDASVTIHNGVIFDTIQEFRKKCPVSEAKQRLSIPEDTILVLILGNTCERKGQIDFVRAVKEIKPKLAGIKAVFYIVGGVEGEYLENIYEYIAENKLEEEVTIVMQTKDTQLYYRACDIFVCASYNESYPRVILEAMAYGLPIVTTPVFGIAEQVYENINGYYFQPGDAAGMAEKLLLLMKRPDLRQQFGKNAGSVLRFINSYREMIEKYEEIIRQAWLSSYRD